VYRTICALSALLSLSGVCAAAPFFSTNDPDANMAVATRPSSAALAIEAADDFIVNSTTTITSVKFHGLIPSAVNVSAISEVRVEIYRIFPLDSDVGRTIAVPTRTNSPSDVAFATRDSSADELTFGATTLSPDFVALNSVVNGINPKPNQTTGGEGPVSGTEIVVSANLNPAIVLPAGHYFFVPQVLVTGGTFLWLSAPKPIVAPGTPFDGDLQGWVRNASLDPDWLRVGTDIVGGATPPQYNFAFSLTDDVIFRNGFD
jgi:hypothetical protein